jgi:hypothetical protein
MREASRETTFPGSRLNKVQVIVLQRSLSTAFLLALALILVIPSGSPSRADTFVDGWEDGPYVVADPSTWAGYYRKTARVRLEAEQRLPNGVSWRLHTDLGSNLAIPRITWMPDAHSVRTANDLLTMVHGGALLLAEQMRRQLEGGNNVNRHFGFPVLEYDHPVVQTDVGLTYATPTLVSLVDLGFVPTDGRLATRILRGLTFDLRSRELFRIEACADSLHPYGAKGGNYRFQFGKLLRLCNTEAYLAFVRLLEAKAAQVAERIGASKDGPAKWCSERGGRVVAPLQEIVLYLTFNGLAVLNTEFDPVSRRDSCTLERNPSNPITLPYRELEPFMVPGAWRDELLKLK